MPHIEHNGARLSYALHGAHGDPVLLIQGVGVIGRRFFRTQTFTERNQHAYEPHHPRSCQHPGL